MNREDLETLLTELDDALLQAFQGPERATGYVGMTKCS
jgi:hypothetical protein